MSIQEHLNKIRNAIYGREVRESIAKGIETAYDDASEKDNANMEVKIARGTNPNLNTRLNKMDETDRQTTAQLAQTDAEARRKKELEDLSPTVLSAIEGGEGTSFNLESIPANESVSRVKTDFLKVSKNLFNKNGGLPGRQLVPSTGRTGPNDSYFTSSFEPITGGLTITQNQTWVISFYADNTESSFVSSLATVAPPTTNPRTMTVPANAKYFRASVSNAEINNYQIEIGSNVTTYEPYKLKINNLETEKDLVQDVILSNIEKDKNYFLKHFVRYNPLAPVSEENMKIFQSFQYASIEGSSPEMPHQLRYVARNIPTYGHRFIIERFNGSSWEQIIDTTTAVQVEENDKGVTVIKYGNADYKVEFHIDFRLWPDAPFSRSFNNPLADSDFVFSRNSFPEVAETSGGGENYDQSLNTTDDVSFNAVSSNAVNADVMAIGGTLPKGTLASPPTGLLSGDAWADTSDSSTHPILRVKL